MMTPKYPVIIIQESYEDPSLTSSNTLNKNGFYLLGSYKIAEKWEPVLRYDQIVLDGTPEGDRNRVTVGLNYLLGKTAVLRLNYDIVSDDGADEDDNQFGVQFAVGF